jgi:hypothetical protein
VRHVQASDSLAGEQILEALRSHGWTRASLRSYITDVDFALDRARRTMGDIPSSPPPALQGDPSGVHLLSARRNADQFSEGRLIPSITSTS